MENDIDPSVEFELAPINLNGRLKYRITALHGDETLHIDTVDIASERSRASFLKTLVRKTEDWDEKIPVADLEASLIQTAREASLGLADGTDTAEDAGEFDHLGILDAFGIDVLGENDDQSIRCWSRNTQKQFIVKSPSNWRAAEILQSVGATVADRLRRDEDDNSGADAYSVDQLQRALALAAADAPRISSSSICGQGVWPHGAGSLIVDGASALVYDGTNFTELSRPVTGNKILELDAAKKWHGHISQRVCKMNQARSHELIKTLTRLTSHWNWTHKWDSKVIAALVMATFVQSLWKWRPLVSITGPSDCGKTTLFQELLLGVFLKWAICADRSTEAGLRQAIAHDAAPVLIDEFDKYRQRQQVLELFRTASRGGKVLRGTADQTGQQFALCHVGWFAAIESGDILGQDRNRFIRFELQRPESRTLSLPGKRELNLLGRELCAAAIWIAPRAVQLADAIKATSIEGVHGRLIESFSVPAAMFAVMWHGREATEAKACAILKMMIDGRETLRDQGEPDETQLVNDILAANIRVTVRERGENISKEQSVGQLLLEYERFHNDLEAKGIRVVGKRGCSHPHLFLVHDQITRYVLKGTRWQDSRIDQVLMRIPGAERKQQRCNSSRRWGIELPVEHCLAGLDQGDANQDTTS